MWSKLNFGHHKEHDFVAYIFNSQSKVLIVLFKYFYDLYIHILIFALLFLLYLSKSVGFLKEYFTIAGQIITCKTSDFSYMFHIVTMFKLVGFAWVSVRNWESCRVAFVTLLARIIFTNS